MEYGAIDLHMRRSQIRIEDEQGTVVVARRIDTTRAEFGKMFGGRPRLRILVESATESEWVAQCLEALGHEVIVADPNYAPMYGQRSRRVKTDIRDVNALTILTRLDRVSLPAALTRVLAPLRAVLSQVQTTLETIEEQVEAIAAADVTAQRLMTAPGVGPILSLTYLAVLDTPARFGGDARRASAFLGVVPSEDSSGERHHKGRITKTGPPELRSLLIQASWAIWRGRSPKGEALRTWAHLVAARRGRRIAIVALARRLSRILFAMWRDETEFKTRARALAA